MNFLDWGRHARHVNGHAQDDLLDNLLRSVFESELSEHIPVVRTSIAGTRLVGRVTVGMSLTDVAGPHCSCVNGVLWLEAWIMKVGFPACQEHKMDARCLWLI